jgi:hypothetical protein
MEHWCDDTDRGKLAVFVQKPVQLPLCPQAQHKLRLCGDARYKPPEARHGTAKAKIINMNYIKIFSPYRAVNTLHPVSKSQSFNAV